MVGDYSELQLRVRDLTNNDAWGTSPRDMHTLVDSLDDSERRLEILQVIEGRWKDTGSTWRNLYKSLQLYEYFLLHGSQTYVTSIKRSFNQDGRSLRTLTRYEYIESQGKDQGINVQAKAKAIIKLLQDDAALGSARDNAAANRKIMLARTHDATSARSAIPRNLRRQSTPSSEPLSPPNKVENYDDWGEMSPAQGITPKNYQPEKETAKMPSLNLIGLDEPEIVKKHEDFEDFDEFQSAEPSPRPPIFTTNTLPAQKGENSAAARPNNGQNDLESFLSMHSGLVDLNDQ